MSGRGDVIAAIAKKHLFFPTLATQNSGDDFREVATWTVKAALEAAFRAGVESASGKPLVTRVAQSDRWYSVLPNRHFESGYEWHEYTRGDVEECAPSAPPDARYIAAADLHRLAHAAGLPADDIDLGGAE